MLAFLRFLFRPPQRRPEPDTMRCDIVGCRGRVAALLMRGDGTFLHTCRDCHDYTLTEMPGQFRVVIGPVPALDDDAVAYALDPAR